MSGTPAIACFSALLLVAGACGARRTAPATPDAAALPPTAERAYRAVSSRIDEDDAMDVVRFMSQYWRVAGNPGYDASIDRLRERLLAAGYSAAERGSAPRLRMETYPNTGRGWDHQAATLRIAGEAEPVFERGRDRVALAINSFSTPPGGLRATLVDVGRGGEAEFAGKDVKGAIVLGDASLGRLWQEAVRKRGAAGVISTEIAPYIRPSDPAAISEEQKDVLQWGSIPYDAEARGFGFKASWRAANRLREALGRGAVTVGVEIAATFYDGPVRTLVAEIPGRSRPDERIVLAAHVQEPGANDNASGCATLYALARALADAIAAGALPPPERTLTFLWLDEIRGSRQWIAAHPEEAKRVTYMFSLDMTGEDTAKTGGTFLVERQADPAAVWPRPSDPHSEWGAGDVKAASLEGSLLNDVHLAAAARRARDTGWVVRSNPYEGGSDHTVFASSGVPSLLNWHFTDRYYHTNQDTPDKTSAREMAHVGITVATSAYLLASASDADAQAVVDLLAAAAARRLALERRQGREIVARASDRAAAEAIERDVVDAWIRWYREALDTVLSLPAAPPSDALRARVAAARDAIR